MPIRLFQTDDLPPEVPGALFSDGETSVLLLSTKHLGTVAQRDWLQRVANSLLAEVNHHAPPPLRAVV